MMTASFSLSKPESTWCKSRLIVKNAVEECVKGKVATLTKKIVTDSMELSLFCNRHVSSDIGKVLTYDATGNICLDIFEAPKKGGRHFNPVDCVEHCDSNDHPIRIKDHLL